MAEADAIFDGLTPEEQAVVVQIATEMEDEGRSVTLEAMLGMEYDYFLPDMETFLTDDYYMGQTGRSLYPKLLDDLIEIFEGGPYIEIHLTGGIGWGKSTVAEFIMARMIAECWVHKDPAAAFGLMPGSTISFVNISVSESQARRVIFKGLYQKVARSPFFKEHCRSDPRVVTELRFPKELWMAPVASTDSSVLGLDLWGGIMDECVTGDSLILMGDGTQKRADAVRTGELVQSVDFKSGRSVSGEVEVRKSTVQECVELELDNGSVLRGSLDHPILVVRDGKLTFELLGAIIDESVVVLKEAFNEQVGEDIQSYESKVGGPGIPGEDVQDAPGTERPCGDIQGEPSQNREGGGQPLLWPEPFSRSQEKGGGCQPWAQGVQGNPCQDECGSQGEALPYGGVQGETQGEKSDTCFSAYPGIKGQDIKIERMGLEEGRFSLLGQGGDSERRSCGVSEPLRVAGAGAFGGVARGSVIQLREHFRSLSLGWGGPSHRPGFCGSNGRQDRGDRGKAPWLHLCEERKSKVGRCNSVLSGSRDGVSGLDRRYTLARVKSKRFLGALPTFSLCVRPWQVFIANGVVTHNTNFMTVVEKSKAAGRGNKRFDLAESVYYSIQRRMKSRFMDAGTIPGKLVIVSSKNYPDTFMERRIKEVRDTGEEGVFIRDYATWEPKRSGTYSGVTFPVEAGSISHTSRILDEEQAKNSVGTIVWVPEEFRKDFERDIDQAVRDLAGIATATINPYFKDFRRVFNSIDDRIHPFTAEATNLLDGADFIKAALVEQEQRTLKFKPRLFPEAPRWVHVDPSVSGDATGIAMGHVAGLIEIDKRDDDTEEWKKEDAPLICIDFMLRVVPPPGGEIRFGSVRQLVYNLTEMGFNIRGVSYDSYQSRESLQHYRERGYQAEQFSVEKEDAYKLLKDAFYEGRIKFYKYAPVLKELRQLEHDGKTGKVDHPPGGSKDVADALCGVVVGLMRVMQVSSKVKYGVQVF